LGGSDRAEHKNSRVLEPTERAYSVFCFPVTAGFYEEDFDKKGHFVPI
jgi:hypothetical protein